MVRLSLSFLATALVAVASAAPIYSQLPFTKIADASRCLPGTDIKEYQSFELLSHELDTYVSKKFESTRLVGGVRGDKNMQKLEFCIVSSDHHCDPIFPTNCVLENVEYRFRVKGPEKGYLQIDGQYVRIVHNFEDASPLSLSNDDRLGVRIAYQYEDGDKNVFATSRRTEEGKPIVLEYPQKDRIRQRFDIIESRKVMKETVGDNKCIPETNIKEYHPFKLLSSNLNTFLSMRFGSKLVYGGDPDDRSLDELEFCVVSTDMECTTAIPTNCIYENVEYRFRINGPVKGYLRVVREELIEIVPEFGMASGLNLYKEQGWGLRVAHYKSNGDLVVITTSTPGRAVFLEAPQKKNDRQWFELVQPENMNEIIESKPNQCIPYMSVKEYESFELYSFNLDTFVSKEFDNNVLVGGKFGDKNLQQVQFCVVSSDHECNPPVPTNCIYENVEYRYRVHSPIKGYLRIEGELVRIVPDFEDATGLRLLRDENRGLRIAKENRGGSISVLATRGPGEPLTLEGAKKRTVHQFFFFAKPYGGVEKTTTSLDRCLPNIDVKVRQPFIIRNHLFDTLVSTMKGDNLIRVGINGNKQFQKLEFSVTPFFEDDAAGDCLQEDVGYRFKAHGQISGYLQVVDGRLVIVREYEKASPLYFHESTGEGVRIGQKSSIGPLTLAANQLGMPLIFQRPEPGKERQVFDLIPSNRISKEESRMKCLLDTDVKEHQPFVVVNDRLNIRISTVLGDNLVRAGVRGNKQFQRLEIIVSPFHSDDGVAGHCLQEDFEYRFEVGGQIPGYLRIEDGLLVVVPEFNDATPLYFLKSSGQGIRIVHKTHKGPYVVTIEEPGKPLTFQRPKSGNDRQAFELIPSTRVTEEPRRKCLPGDFKVNQPFLILIREFDTFVSSASETNFLRAGVNGNKHFQKLEFTVTPFYGDFVTGECIYEDVDYKFRVTGQASGYLGTENGFIFIVPDSSEASPLYFLKSSGKGLRIGELTPDGPLVMTAVEPGLPLTLQHVEFKNERQLYDLIPSPRN